ncbi:MAG TPA: SDR family NAD(P)-dependent oxidoreductase [Streptosporangiaceae bacterium]|nr:SDR family NAD(P)-dependent oxidoreductase [Streptosporangiaceae bacterium]
MNALAGKVAIVTGASRGIGAGIAKEFAAQGARVVVNYLAGQAGAGAVIEHITPGGGTAIAVQADVSDKDDVKRLFATAIAEYGTLDVLVKNAAVYVFEPIEQVDQAGFLRCHEAGGADEQGPLESGGECLRGRGAGGQQVAGAAGRDPAEHRQAGRGPELERGGDQGRGQSGLILRHARVRGRLHTGIQQPDRLSMIGDLDGAGQGAACRLPDGSVFDRRRHDRGVVSGRRSAAAPKSRADLACGGQPRECLGDRPGGSGGLDHLVDGRLDCLGLAGALVG